MNNMIITVDALLKRLNRHYVFIADNNRKSALRQIIRLRGAFPDWIVLNFANQRFMIVGEHPDDLANLARTEGVLADGETVEGESPSEGERLHFH